VLKKNPTTGCLQLQNTKYAHTFSLPFINFSWNCPLRRLSPLWCVLLTTLQNSYAHRIYRFRRERYDVYYFFLFEKLCFICYKMKDVWKNEIINSYYLIHNLLLEMQILSLVLSSSFCHIFLTSTWIRYSISLWWWFNISKVVIIDNLS
jgi:hypothetical protein